MTTTAQAQYAICTEILEIMQVYHEQEKSYFGVDTPGGLEHMGDVWALFMKWEKLLETAIAADGQEVQP